MNNNHIVVAFAFLITILAIKINAQPPEQASQRFEKSQIPFFEFINNIKTIKIDVDTKDDVIKKIGSPSNVMNVGSYSQMNYYMYASVDGATVAVKIGSNARVEGVLVQKGLDVIYKKGNW
jgi:hypothetical protein